MSDVIGRGVIEVSADSAKFKAGIDDARRTIKSFGKDVQESVGTASAGASKSIDRYVKGLQTAAATSGKSTRETELYKLALRGASEQQLAAANSALRLSEAYADGQKIGAQLRVGLVAVAAAAVAAAGALAAGTVALISQVGQYQDIAEKIGDTARNVSSLKTAADVSGASIDSVAAASVRLTAALSKTDDESKSVGAAIKALGLNFGEFKKQSPVEQLETIARALEGFADGSEKTAVATALFGKAGADVLGFLKEYAVEGRAAAYVTAQQAAAADEFSDSQARLKSQIQQFLQTAAVGVIPTLTQVAELFTATGKAAGETSIGTDILNGAMKAATVVFQTIAVVASDLIFIFRGVQNELGAIAAQLVALATLDFKGFSAIGAAVSEDASRARAELDRFQAKVLEVGRDIGKTAAASPVATAAAQAFQAGLVADAAARARKPRLNTAGLARAGAGGGGASGESAAARAARELAQVAKAQLALDVESLRKAQAAVGETIANGEKLLSAQRSAGLVSDAAYYAAKRRNVQEAARVEETFLQAEIARLQQEKLTGADRLDNERKIADAQAKLARSQASASTELQVLAIEQQASLDAIARAYGEARIAAQLYFEATEAAQQSDLAGAGQGGRARDRAAAVAQIRERYESQRLALERDRRAGAFDGRDADYQRELALINEFQGKSLASYAAYYEALSERQGDFTLGAREGLQNYLDDSMNVFKQTEEAVNGAFRGMEEAVVQFALTGKLSFSSFAKSVIADLIRIQARQAIVGLIGLFTGGGGGAGALAESSSGAYIRGRRASGGPVEAGGAYLVGERGPEILQMGSQAGRVIANDQIAAGGGKTLRFDFSGQTINVGANVSRGEVLAAVQQGNAATEQRIRRLIAQGAI